MRVTLLTIGSRGEVQPYVALGMGLKNAGYDIRLATHDIFREFVTGYGLDFAPIEGNPRPLVQQDAGQTMLGSGRNPLSFMQGFAQLASQIYEKLLADSVAACQDSDAILFSTLGFPGWHIAKKLGIPSISAPLQPMTRTRAFPALAMPGLPNLGGRFNWLTPILAEQLFWQPLRSLIDRWRRETLGLPSLPLKGPFDTLIEEQLPIVCGYSPLVVPKPGDWPEWVQVTGYWFLPANGEWKPPAALTGFLQSGPPPVYLGFGSMGGRTGQKLWELAIEAVTLAKQRAILLGGWAADGNTPLSDDIFCVDSIPHDWLFPRMAAVVHHGGAGTTAAGLRAGVPSILTPLFADQPFWGMRIHALGVGPRPIPSQRLTAHNLADAITLAVNDEAMRARASALGERIRLENGVSRAVKIIQQIVPP